MKKNILFITFLFILSLLIAGSALAYGFGDIGSFYKATAGSAGYSASASDTQFAIVGGIVTILFGVAGTIFAFLFFYAGISWLIAAGNEEKIGKAKKTITYAITGIFIVAAAAGIATLISSAISGTGTPATPANPSTPTGISCYVEDKVSSPPATLLPGQCVPANQCSTSLFTNPRCTTHAEPFQARDCTSGLCCRCYQGTQQTPQ